MASETDATIPTDVKVCPVCGSEFRLKSPRYRSKFAKQKNCSTACTARAAVLARDPARRIVDMPIGSRWGLWTVVSSAGAGNWNCTCDCGMSSVVNGVSLRIGNSKSCGCQVPDISRSLGAATATHGMTKTTEYGIWRGIKTRCDNENHPNFQFYGARGISMCDRWRDSFEAFYEDMGPRPSSSHSIERLRSDGNYEPGNCKWGTDQEQSHNRSSNHWVTYRGERMLLTEAASVAGLPHSTVTSRIKRGWPESRWFEAANAL